MKETKAFYKTSEFWLMALGQLVILLQYAEVWTLFHGRFEFLAPTIQAVLAYGYIQSRGHAKSGVPATGDEAGIDEFTQPTDGVKEVVVTPGTNVETQP